MSVKIRYLDSQEAKLSGIGSDRSNEVFKIQTTEALLWLDVLYRKRSNWTLFLRKLNMQEPLTIVFFGSMRSQNFERTEKTPFSNSMVFLRASPLLCVSYRDKVVQKLDGESWSHFTASAVTDLTPCDLFSCRYLKNNVYLEPFITIWGLETRIV